MAIPHSSSNNCISEDSSGSSSLNPRKRKRSQFSTDGSSSDGESFDHSTNNARALGSLGKKSTPKIVTGVRLPRLIYPRSLYNSYDEQTGPAIRSEKDALKEALVNTMSQSLAFRHPLT